MTASETVFTTPRLAKIMRIVLIILVTIVLYAAPVLPRADSPAFFDFADRRSFFGIPNTSDVLSNAAFLVVGVAGCASLRRRRIVMRSRSEAAAIWTLFLGLTLTAFGSAWFHLDVSRERLLWDRLPMAITFAGFIAMLFNDRSSMTTIFDHRPAPLRDRTATSFVLLIALIVLCVSSVVWWYATDDLKPYAFVQAWTVIGSLAVVLLFPAFYTHQRIYAPVFLCYGAAKLFELFEHPIFELTRHIVSGHTLKHLASAAAGAFILMMLRKRTEFRSGQST